MTLSQKGYGGLGVGSVYSRVQDRGPVKVRKDVRCTLGGMVHPVDPEREV